MMNAASTTTIISPADIPVRGRLRERVSLAKRCWFGVGGPADWLFTPQDEADLQQFLRELPADIPVMVIGVGSNLLVRDGGIAGVVIRLGRGFTDIHCNGTTVQAGAAALDVHVAAQAAEHEIAGMEFLAGIPGTIGGAVKMNAGAYGADMAACLRHAIAIDRQGARHVLDASMLAFEYRRSALPEGWIITQATLDGCVGSNATITRRMEEITASRAATQPVRSKTGGSTFKNPEGHKAWELIDRAGCRGLRHGDAELSKLHCNFLINHGQASADDLESLGEQVRAAVKQESGVELEWEIKRIGRARADR